MRKYLVILTIGIMVSCFPVFTWSYCPEMPSDHGVCDTVYVEVYPQDKYVDPNPPYFIRFPIFITHDVPDPVIDSIEGLVMALCYTHTNPAKYCSLSYYWNTISFSGLLAEWSIFRHLVSGADTTHNWMMDLYEEGNGEEWNGKVLDLVGGTSHFWFSAWAGGSEDQSFGEGSRVLLLTMTFKLEDTTTICVDTCFWPPHAVGLMFVTSEPRTFIPRDNLRYCKSILIAKPGDANGDLVLDIADVLYMINYLFRFGPAPVSFGAGDANCDHDHGILDVAFLINYLFKGGPVPGCP